MCRRQASKFGEVSDSLSLSVGLPAEDGAGPGEAAAEGDEEDDVAAFDAALAVGFVEGDGDGGGGGVAVFVDIDEGFFFGEAEAVGDGGDDAGVGLVGDDHGDVGLGEAGHFEGLLAGLTHAGDGVFEGFTAFHVDGVGARGGVFGGDGEGAAAAGDF